jgi:hypothetical protein
MAALQLLRTAKDGIGRFLWRATLQTSGLYVWNQWIAGSIFLKCEYPEKHNKISGLDGAIPCKWAGVERLLTMRQAS